MQKKKIIVLISIILISIFLGWYITRLVKNDGKSMTELINFAVEDTSKIDRLIISDAAGLRFEVKRTKQGWVDANDGCIIQEHVKLILETIKNIEFKGYVTENSRNEFIKLMSAQSTKLEIYKDGNYSKTWFIGPSTQDHYGQVMLLDTDEGGKSDLPVLMKVKGFNGIIEPRFFADPRKWQCTRIMGFTIGEIKKVEYRNLLDAEKSFSIKHEDFQFKIKQNGRILTQVDTTKIFRYLQNFSKVHFELPNYVLTEKQVDSVKNSPPFATLKIESTSKKPLLLRCFRIDGEEMFDSEIAEYVNYDMNRFWCQLPSGELVKCQYYVFDPIFRGDIYFPFDKSNYKNKEALDPKK
jgi:hypothetical protein